LVFSHSVLFLDLSFQFLILHSLTSVSTQFQVAILTSFILFHCLRPFYSDCSETTIWFPTSQLSYGDRLSDCHPTPNLKGQPTVFINPGVGWSSYTPRQRVPILVAFYDLQGLQSDYSFPRSPNGDSRTFIPIILNGDI
jgi:hypothetical protein